MLAPGTLVTVIVSGEARGLITKTDLLAAVIVALQDYSLAPVSSSIEAGSTIYNAITFQWLHYDYRATLTLTVPSDSYDSINDVAADVRNVFSDVAGSEPTGVQASQVGVAPAIDAPAGGSLLPDVGTFVEANVRGLLLIVLAVVVLIVITVGWGKNVGALASLHT